MVIGTYWDADFDRRVECELDDVRSVLAKLTELKGLESLRGLPTLIMENDNWSLAISQSRETAGYFVIWGPANGNEAYSSINADAAVDGRDFKFDSDGSYSEVGSECWIDPVLVYSLIEKFLAHRPINPFEHQLRRDY